MQLSGKIVASLIYTQREKEFRKELQPFSFLSLSHDKFLFCFKSKLFLLKPQPADAEIIRILKITTKNEIKNICHQTFACLGIFNCDGGQLLGVVSLLLFEKELVFKIGIFILAVVGRKDMPNELLNFPVVLYYPSFLFGL